MVAMPTIWRERKKKMFINVVFVPKLQRKRINVCHFVVNNSFILYFRSKSGRSQLVDLLEGSASVLLPERSEFDLDILQQLSAEPDVVFIHFGQHHACTFLHAFCTDIDDLFAGGGGAGPGGAAGHRV